MQDAGETGFSGKTAEKTRKKIGFFVTKGVWGGAQKYVYNLATALPKDEYDVFVVTGAGDLLPQKLEEAGIRKYVIRSLRRDISVIGEIRSLISLFRIVWKEKPDTLHLNSPKAAGLGSLAGRILFVRNIVQTAHGFSWNEDRKPVSTTLIVFFTWLTMLFCHKTIVLSEREKRQAEILPFVKKKLHLIRNGAETIAFKEKEEARRALAAISEKKMNEKVLWIGTIAELHRNKGLQYAIEAIAKIKEPANFVVIGSGEEARRIHALIQKLKLEHKVFVLGFLPKAPEYLKAFDIFTLTSIKEGLPYAVLEAGQAGLPVVATAVGGIPEIIQNGVSGAVINPRKVGELSRALEYLIRNPDKRKLFGENLEKKVAAEFSMKEMLQKTEALY
jgi:glycosyltransferase involved in cell wall biosynthesis